MQPENVKPRKIQTMKNSLIISHSNTRFYILRIFIKNQFKDGSMIDGCMNDHQCGNV